MHTAAITLFLVTTPSVALAQRYLLEKNTAAAIRPVEVAAEKGFIIHAIPRNTDCGWIPPQIFGGQDYILTHTLLPDGKLKVLLRSGVYRTFSPPMGINRIGYHKTELIGVAVKHKRIAVLTRHLNATLMQLPKAAKSPKYGKPKYRLTLFDARDGEKLSELPLDQVKVPGVAKLWVIGAGPLKLRKDRISLWKRSIRIDQQGRMILQ